MAREAVGTHLSDDIVGTSMKVKTRLRKCAGFQEMEVRKMVVIGEKYGKLKGAEFDVMRSEEAKRLDSVKNIGL